jgi:hypothetical protein
VNELPLNELVALWIDEVAAGLGGNAYVTAKLLERHRRYYAWRVPGLVCGLASTAWQGACPFCGGAFDVDGASGTWRCDDCYRRGEAYSLEFQLYGHNRPQRWEACRVAVEAVMSGEEQLGYAS